MLKAAVHRGCDNSVINDPLGEPGRTTSYVGLLPTWGSVDSDLMFYPICRWVPFWGLWQTYMNERLNRPVVLVMEYPIPVHGDPVEEHEGPHLLGTLRERYKEIY